MADRLPHQLIVARKSEFFHRLMIELAGNAHISLEGDLAHCRLTDDLVKSRDETPILKRGGTLWPKQDFVVLRLRAETVDAVFKPMMAAGLRIIHVQIERDGVLELGAYDNLQCVGTGPGVDEALLGDAKWSE
jgi:hypothetical protein